MGKESIDTQQETCTKGHFRMISSMEMAACISPTGTSTKVHGKMTTSMDRASTYFPPVKN